MKLLNTYKRKEIIENNLIYIATVNKDNNPNLAIAEDVKVLDDNTIIISVNEMVNTPRNILNNENVILISLNEEKVGLKIFGVAKYYAEGEYVKFCKDTFFNNNKVLDSGITEPKGAILINVVKVDDII